MSTILPSRTLGDLASSIPGATRIFNNYRLDFCCGGSKTLEEAARKQGLEIEPILKALASLDVGANEGIDWREASSAELSQYIVRRFHERHREQLPELIRLSRRVERVHAGNASCPAGLADNLEAMQQELESHMMKEEQVLFPMLQRGMHAQAQAPISVMRFEHDHHGESLEAILALTHDITAPEDACNTWRALYAGLKEFKEDLMQHIHLENNVLFINSTDAAGVHNARV